MEILGEFVRLTNPMKDSVNDPFEACAKATRRREIDRRKEDPQDRSTYCFHDRFHPRAKRQKESNRWRNRSFGRTSARSHLRIVTRRCLDREFSPSRERRSEPLGRIRCPIEENQVNICNDRSSQRHADTLKKCIPSIRTNANIAFNVLEGKHRFGNQQTTSDVLLLTKPFHQVFYV